MDTIGESQQSDSATYLYVQGSSVENSQQDVKTTLTYTASSSGGGSGGEEEEQSSSGSISGTGGPSPAYAMKLNIGYIR